MRMIRGISLTGMAGGFLLISPSLRQDLADAGTQSLAYLNAHSPFSYVAAAVAAIGMLALLVRSAEAPR
jgi:hypothetical protein